MAPRSFCTICGAEDSSLRTSPTTCAEPHTQDERACGECWEAYISMHLEEKLGEQIACMFCESVLPEKAIKALSRKGTGERCDAERQGRTKDQCQNRCQNSRILHAGGTPVMDPETQSFRFALPDHNLATDGRVFACQYCGFQTCVECDRPEHIGQNCAEYQTQRDDEPIKVEAKIDNRICKNCPNCKVYFIGTKGCGYTICTACRYRFCQRCLIPWVGERSAYLGGARQHGAECTYRDRSKPSDHALKDRFDMKTEDGGNGVSAKKKRKHQGGVDATAPAQKTQEYCQRGDASARCCIVGVKRRCGLHVSAR
ncbi:hypothetical protein Tdes44962_MAKER09870 [Teratosphaeria destructans]|uniref:RING-type domain-containing protein n=1 Tax=Teratosphaeria destructans TaxID=418781 RepID=A0A9W7W256_9PEZI|nr:hypothetical protein Tdes44962_MAKER09870 [Teratosphaeria destructans]